MDKEMIRIYVGLRKANPAITPPAAHKLIKRWIAYGVADKVEFPRDTNIAQALTRR